MLVRLALMLKQLHNAFYGNGLSRFVVRWRWLSMANVGEGSKEREQRTGKHGMERRDDTVWAKRRRGGTLPSANGGDACVAARLF